MKRQEIEQMIKDRMIERADPRTLGIRKKVIDLELIDLNRMKERETDPIAVRGSKNYER